MLLRRCSSERNTRLIAEVAEMVSCIVEAVGLGSKRWPKCVNALCAFIWIISYPFHSNRDCPLCDVNSLDSHLYSLTLSALIHMPLMVRQIFLIDYEHPLSQTSRQEDVSTPHLTLTLSSHITVQKL